MMEELRMKGDQMMKNGWKSLCERVKTLFYDPHGGEQLFWIGFILYLGVAVWATTMFPQFGVISKSFKLCFIACMGLKILLYDRYAMKEVAAIILSGICVVGTLYEARYVDPFMWLLLLTASRGIQFRKILQVYLLVAGGICVLAFAASMLDIIENLQYETDTRGIRNSFGIIYPTDCGAHVFFWMLSLFYLLGERIRGIHCIAGIFAGFLVYRFCNARVDAGCIIMTALLFWIGNFIVVEKKSSRRIFQIWNKLWERLGPLVMPGMAILSIILTALYQEGSSVWNVLDSTLVSRLRYGKQAFTEYGIKLFGQKIEMVGNGGSLELKGEYFFLDCSYVNILMTWGIVSLIIVLALFWHACRKNRKDLHFQYAIAVIAVNCVIAHHMMDIAYDPFVLAAVAVGMGKGIHEAPKF